MHELTFGEHRDIRVKNSLGCNGEQVAGFKDKDGRFEEVMLIRNESDLETFRKEYGITGEIEKEY